MSRTEQQRTALVFGASGLVGRHLILALVEHGVVVMAACRSDASAGRLREWLAEHGVDDLPGDVRVDFTDPDLLPGGPAAFAEVTEIYNCAGSYQFGMSTEQARTANVKSVERLVGFAARLPRLERLVHVSGYRVGGQDPETVPWSPERVRETYRRLGPYEASKVESDAVLQARAQQLSVPWSIVNPSTVIGDSKTGESDQQLGLAASLKGLWHGKVAAMPGNSDTFVPVVSVDYLARFMTLLPVDQDTVGKSYWILDDNTPPLPGLLKLVGGHYRVKVPRVQIPVGLIKRLPQAITRADPETLTFLSSDRYPTQPALTLAKKHDLHLPDTDESIVAWADYLAAHRFGDAPGGIRRFTHVAGVRTFEVGEPAARTLVLPGLPVNADTWAKVVDLAPGSRAVDLPGLGMSSGSGRRDWHAWLDGLLGSSRTHLVGHSIGAAAALEAARAHPDRVTQLTLVSPFFLQAPAGLTSRVKPLACAYLRRVSSAVLSERLTGDPNNAPSLESSVEDLQRSTASVAAALLAHASNAGWRVELRQMLGNFRGDLHVVVGDQDPLAPEGHELLESLPRATLTVLPDAGHHPQLTHPGDLTAALRLDAAIEAPSRSLE